MRVMKHSYFNNIGMILSLLVCIYFFLVGINGLSSAMKLFSNGYIDFIFQKFSNPFVGLFIGILTTAIMQSSSATTAITISMVSSQTLSLQNAVPIIMGANIGTTVTNTLIALGHINKEKEYERAVAASTLHDFYNITTTAFLFPLEYYFQFVSKGAIKIYSLFAEQINITTSYKSPIKSSIQYGSNLIQKITFYPAIYFIISLILIFTGLFFIVEILKANMLKKIKDRFNTLLFSSPLKAWAFGTTFTVLVQSSSVTTSLAIPLAATDTLSLEDIYPYTVGANVGTGITAFLAAASLNPIAMMAAITSLIFDLFGLFFIYPMPIIGRIPIWTARAFAYQSMKHKFIPIAYLGTIFIVLPMLVIFSK